MDVCFIARASDIAAVGSNIGRKASRQAGRQAALSSPSEGERGRMPSPSDHHGNPCTSRHGVVSCVLPCPASMATANLPNSSVDDNLQDFLLLPLLLPLFLSLSSSLLKKNPFIPVKCDSDLVPYDNRLKETRRLRIHARSYLDANKSSLQSSSSRDYIYISR